MFVGGIASGFLILVILAAIGLSAITGVLAALVLKVFGLTWARAFGVGLGLSFAGMIAFGMFQARDVKPIPPESRVQIPLEIPRAQ